MADSSKRDEKMPAIPVQVPKKKGRKVKPKGFPNRPLSAYNLFFKEERQKVLNLDFQTMGREISTRWKKISKEDRERFQALAKIDAQRYKKEVQIYEEEQVLKAREERETGNGLQGKGPAKKSSQGGTTTVSAARKPAAQGQDTSPRSPFDEGPGSQLAAATVRAMEEKNHPDAPQRLSPCLRPTGVPGASHNVMLGYPSTSMNLAAIQQQQRNPLHLQMAFGLTPQVAQTQLNGAVSVAGLLERLEQLRRQEEANLIVQEYLRLQQQEQAAIRALSINNVASFPISNVFSPGPSWSGSNQTLQQLLFQGNAAAAAAAASYLQGPNLGWEQSLPSTFNANSTYPAGKAPPKQNNG